MALDEAALRALSARLLDDLKEARDRLNQGPENSSRPPSSRAPWERGASPEPTDESTDDSAEAEPAEAKPARKPGKPPGAPGIGRTQVFQAHEERPHYPAACAGCGRPLAPAGAVAYSGFQAVDLRWGDPARPGLTLWVVDHRYYETLCACGHRTRAGAGQGVVDPLLAGIELSEWRLVGPGLAVLIVALAYRFRLSRARIREFLGEWLGLDLSVGTIHRTLHEAGAAVAPVEDELVEAVLASTLLHADETPWPEHDQTLWLWVFRSLTVTLYYVAGRGKELLENVLEGFTGWLMSDGWGAYRHYPRRLRCLGAPDPQGAGLGTEWRPRGPSLWRARPEYFGKLDGGGVCGPRRSAPGCVADPTGIDTGRVARGLRTTPGSRPPQNPRLGGGVAQRLGGHLPDLESSRAAADQQRRRTRPAALGHPAQAQSGHPHPGGLAGFRPARQRHRHLPPAGPCTLALSRTGHRRPPRRMASRPLTSIGD